MRRIKIVSDSSSDILELSGAEYSYAPMKIITAEREFVDDGDIDLEEMVRFFAEYKGRSKTSCPNAGDWLMAFGDADDIICVTITSALSGSYNSACAAKQIYESENAGRRVYVVDTLSAGPENTLIVEKLAEYIREGMTYEDICKNIEEYKKSTGLIFMLKSLNNFANNGRVSPAVAKIAGVMGICIVGKASDEGTLEPTHKCRGEARSLETLISDLKSFGVSNGRVSIAHAQNEPAALKLKEMILERIGSVKVDIHKLRGLCSFYAEIGGMLVGFEKE